MNDCSGNEEARSGRGQAAAAPGCDRGVPSWRAHSFGGCEWSWKDNLDGCPGRAEDGGLH